MYRGEQFPAALPEYHGVYADHCEHTQRSVLWPSIDHGGAQLFGNAKGVESWGRLRFGDLRSYQAGRYKFDTKDEENAKTTLRAALRKNSAIFHRLPQGEYGLLGWYPNAKPQSSSDDEGDTDTKRTGKKGKNGKKTKDKGAAQQNKPDADYFTNDEIREAVFSMSGSFQASDVEKELKSRFPSKQFRENALPMLIFKLKKKGFIKMVSERQGNQGAKYAKI